MILIYCFFALLALATISAMARRGMKEMNVVTAFWSASVFAWAIIADLYGNAFLPGIRSQSGMVFLAVFATAALITGAWNLLYGDRSSWIIVFLFLGVAAGVAAIADMISLVMSRSSAVPLLVLIATWVVWPLGFWWMVRRLRRPPARTIVNQPH